MVIYNWIYLKFKVDDRLYHFSAFWCIFKLVSHHYNLNNQHGKKTERNKRIINTTLKIDIHVDMNLKVYKTTIAPHSTQPPIIIKSTTATISTINYVFHTIVRLTVSWWPPKKWFLNKLQTQLINWTKKNSTRARRN